MGYTPTIWHENQMTTQEKTDGLINIETQWGEGCDYLDTITHSDRYYTKDEMDAKYYREDNDGEGSGLVCETVDGYTADNLLDAAIPGGLIGWYQNVSPPTGWYLCNGFNDTPNLIDCFLIGAGDTYLPGDTGGSDTVTCSGTITSGNHTLTIEEIPPHYHVLNDYYGSGSGGFSGNPYPDTSVLTPGTTTIGDTTNSSVGGGAHNHSGTFIGSNLDKRPPYYALTNIMKG